MYLVTYGMTTLMSKCPKVYSDEWFQVTFWESRLLFSEQTVFGFGFETITRGKSTTINIICIKVKNEYEFTKSLFVKTPYICEDPLYKNSPICLGLFGLTWPHFWRRPDFYSFYKRALNWYFPCKWKCYVTIYYSINIHT